MNWADLCGTPDINDDEEQEFLPLDESVFESNDNDNAVDVEEPHPSSKQGNITLSADTKPVPVDSQTTGKIKQENDSVDQGGKEGNINGKDGSIIVNEEVVDQQKTVEPNVEEVKSIASGEFVNNGLVDQVDILKKSQQVIEERLRVASNLSKVKSKGGVNKQLLDIDLRSECGNNKKGGKLEGISKDSLRAAEVREFPNLRKTKEAILSKSDDPLVKREGTSKQEGSIVISAENICSQEDGSSLKQNDSQIKCEEEVSKEGDASLKGDCPSLKDKNKALLIEDCSKPEEKDNEEPTNSELNNKFENCSVQTSEVKNNSKRSAAMVDTTEVKTSVGLNNEKDAGQRSDEDGNIEGSSIETDPSKNPETNANSDGPGVISDMARRRKNEILRASTGSESPPCQRSHRDNVRMNRNEPVVHNENLKTVQSEDREGWKAAQFKGLQDHVLDNRTTRYFVIEIGQRELASTLKTKRCLLPLTGPIADALETHLPQPVVIFMLLPVPNRGLKLCAIASALSKPYSFDASGKFGERRKINLFDLRFLCKAKTRNLWSHPSRHQDELKRGHANGILGEYARSIKNGLIDRILDKEQQGQNVS